MFLLANLTVAHHTQRQVWLLGIARLPERTTTLTTMAGTSSPGNLPTYCQLQANLEKSAVPSIVDSRNMVVHVRVCFGRSEESMQRGLYRYHHSRALGFLAKYIPICKTDRYHPSFQLDVSFQSCCLGVCKWNRPIRKVGCRLRADVLMHPPDCLKPPCPCH